MHTALHSRRFLQIAIIVAACVPITAGLAGIVLGVELDAQAMPSAMTSHGRYLSGLLLGIGICFWSFVPTIEQHGQAIRLLTGIVLIGGFARLAGVLFFGDPLTVMTSFALMMELIITPALCLWQAMLARPGFQEA